jgi:hypothetical protein
MHPWSITNPSYKIPLWQQKAGRGDEHMVVWVEYNIVWKKKLLTVVLGLSCHAIIQEQRVWFNCCSLQYWLICNHRDSAIYDFDTVLPFPSPSDIYVMETFKPNLMLKEEYQACFRLISANKYLNHFQSDRSHMVNISSMLWSIYSLKCIVKRRWNIYCRATKIPVYHKGWIQFRWLHKYGKQGGWVWEGLFQPWILWNYIHLIKIYNYTGWICTVAVSQTTYVFKGVSCIRFYLSLWN